MKILFLLLISLRLTAQDSLLYKSFPVVDGKVNYTNIFNVDSLSKDKIFAKVKDWAVNSYKSQKATLEAEDKEAGYIAYKGYLSIILEYQAGLFKGKPFSVEVYHTLKFYIKDEKVKMVFTDLETVSNDAASNYLNDNTKYPIEGWNNDMNNYNDKKKKKIIEVREEQAATVHKQFQIFLAGVVKDISSKKSAFDF